MAKKSSRQRFTTTQWIITLLILALAWFVFTRITPQDAAPETEQPATTAEPTFAAGSADEPTVEPAEAATQPAGGATASAATPQGAAQAGDPTPTAAPTAASPAAALCNTEQVSNLPAIAYADLPPQAQATIALIEAGGPFPYAKDGSTFQNREGILPDEAHGYYREYTVTTPGESDRGARRLVGGEVNELYYTDDHYASFSEVLCP